MELEIDDNDDWLVKRQLKYNKNVKGCWMMMMIDNNDDVCVCVHVYVSRRNAPPRTTLIAFYSPFICPIIHPYSLVLRE